MLFAVLLAAGHLGAPSAAAAPPRRPTLQKVFVYSGDDRIRLVALFDEKLAVSRLAPRLQEEAVAVHLPGARGGRALRHFEVGQGGYARLEAKEGPGGLWLRVRAQKDPRSLEGRVDVAVSGSSLTLTLPRLTAAAPPPVRAASRPEKPHRPARAASPPTPEGIINQVLSPSPANAAPVPAKRAPEPKAAGRFALPRDFGPGKGVSSSKGAAPAGFREAGVGAGVQSLTGFTFQVAAVLGGMLALILGGFLLLKRIAPKTAARLGPGGKLVRTLHKAHLAPRQVIAVVEVAGEVLVIGISGQNISMLTKLENEATLARIREEGSSSFADHLSKFLGKAEEEGRRGAAGKGAGPEPAPAGSPVSGSPEKTSAALLAYARSLSADGGSGKDGEKKADPSRRALAPAGAGVPGEGTGPGRAAARLRQRLERLSPQLTGSAFAS